MIIADGRCNVNIYTSFYLWYSNNHREEGQSMRISTKCSIAVHCILFLHEYGEEQKVTSGLLALSTGCNPVVIRNITSSLKKAGIIESASGRGGMRLACPIQEITLYRVCMVVEPHCLEDLVGLHSAPSSLCPIGKNIHATLQPSYDKLRENMRAALDAITLLDIVEDYQKIKDEKTSASS